MTPRFPPLLPQHQINARTAVRAVALHRVPSLPWGEWLVVALGVLLLAAL